MIGKEIAHYRIEAKLGEGGMGEVYLAEDTTLERKVALKFLPASLHEDAIARQRFIREAKAAAALEHPYICNIKEVSQAEDGQDFIVMEYVPGQTLRDRLTEGRLSMREVLQVGIEVAEALEEAHSAGIAHRDLKPANIMLTKGGHVKILDFGLAKKVVEEDGNQQEITAALTREGTTLGTVAYMSPEQLRGRPVDTRSDIFSFGIVLYELLTGIHPFRAGAQAETVSAILTEQTGRLSRYVESVPDLLQHTIDKMLEKDPGDRFQSVHEARTNLVHIQEEISGSRPLIQGEKKKNFWMGAAGVLAVIVILILASYWVYRPPPGEPTRARSIAVLPLDNLSTEPDTDYFSDGLTEDIIIRLSKISELKVINRASVMLYKDTDKSLPQIAGELGVATILKGSVRRSDGRVRIVAELIDPETQQNLWAETFDHELEDIFAIQSDAAEQIALALQVELSAEDREWMDRRPTTNLTAYDFYLKGRDFAFRMTRQDNEAAIQLYKRALELDPDFSLAHVGLARAYWTGVEFHGYSKEELETAVEEAQEALSIEPTTAEAHSVLANIYQLKGWKEKVWEETRKSLELDPNNDAVLMEAGWKYLNEWSFDEAYPLFRKALALNPRAVQNYWSMGYLYSFFGEYDRAEPWVKKGLEIQPDDLPSLDILCLHYLIQDRLEEASEVCQRVLSSREPDANIFDRVAKLAWKMGKRAEALEYARQAYQLNRFWWETYAAILLETGKRTEAEKILAEAFQQAEELQQSGNEWPANLNKANARILRGDIDIEDACRYLKQHFKANPGWSQVQNYMGFPFNLQDAECFQQLVAEIRAQDAEKRRRLRELEKEWEE